MFIFLQLGISDNRKMFIIVCFSFDNFLKVSKILFDLCTNENEAKIMQKDCSMYSHVQVSGAYMDSECYVPSSLKTYGHADI